MKVCGVEITGIEEAVKRYNHTPEAARMFFNTSKRIVYTIEFQSLSDHVYFFNNSTIQILAHDCLYMDRTSIEEVKTIVASYM